MWLNIALCMIVQYVPVQYVQYTEQLLLKIAARTPFNYSTYSSTVHM